MKTYLKLFVCTLLLFTLSSQSASAQLGGLLKKAKKTVETVAKTQTSDTATEDLKASKDLVKLPNGGTMFNPLSSVIDVQLEGCYGKSLSTNFGEVYLVLKVKMLINKNKVTFGGASASKGVSTMAVDSDGNVYKSESDFSSQIFDVSEGLLVKIKLDDKSLVFQDVKKTVQMMQQIKLNCYIDAKYRDVIEFNEIPINWESEPQ